MGIGCEGNRPRWYRRAVRPESDSSGVQHHPLALPEPQGHRMARPRREEGGDATTLCPARENGRKGNGWVMFWLEGVRVVWAGGRAHREEGTTCMLQQPSRYDGASEVAMGITAKILVVHSP